MQQLLFVDELISATKSAKEIRQASIKLGSRLFKTISKLGIKFDNNCFINYYQQVESGDYFGHHALAYGALCGSLDLQYDYCMLNFAYSQLSAMINTGVKLIPLSQTIGQQLLYALHPTLIEAIKRLEHLSVDDLGKTTPGFELRSIQHEKLYSRLYIS
jgi:urease accessory protein